MGAAFRHDAWSDDDRSACRAGARGERVTGAVTRESFAARDYRWVAELVNHVGLSQPENRAARELRAAALEQLGDRAKSGIWRAFYLSGTQELREEVAPASQGIQAARRDSFLHGRHRCFWNRWRRGSTDPGPRVRR